jgi:hypothetical protein
VIPSNEHLVHKHMAERLAAAQAHRARRIADEWPEPPRAARAKRRILLTLALPLHPTKKGRPA